MCIYDDYKTPYNIFQLRWLSFQIIIFISAPMDYFRNIEKCRTNFSKRRRLRLPCFVRLMHHKHLLIFSLHWHKTKKNQDSHTGEAGMRNRLIVFLSIFRLINWIIWLISVCETIQTTKQLMSSLAKHWLTCFGLHLTPYQHKVQIRIIDSVQHACKTFVPIFTQVTIIATLLSFTSPPLQYMILFSLLSKCWNGPSFPFL